MPGNDVPPYVPLLVFPDGRGPTGGDSLTEDLNLYYQVRKDNAH